MTEGGTPPTEALRATSDELLRDLDALAVLELEKRQTPHGDPRLVELAKQIEAIARRVLDGSIEQRILTKEANRAVAAGDADPRGTVERTARSAAEILAEWRAAEQRAGEAEPRSAEAMDAETLAERLRDEYREAFDAARPDRSG